MRIKVYRRGVCVAIVKPDFLGFKNLKYYPWQDLGINPIFSHEQNSTGLIFT